LEMKKLYIGVPLVVLVIALLALYAYQPLIESQKFAPQRFAHAGGGGGGKIFKSKKKIIWLNKVKSDTYTNSYEALDSNIKNEFVYFEIDFSFTKDGKLACLHDWKRSFKRAFGFETDKKVTLAEFEKLVQEKSIKYTNCTLEGLALWMMDNPGAFIVTDVKEANVKALNMIRKKLPDAKVRVIPQIYNPSNFEFVKDAEFQQVIWTLYRYGGSNDEVIGWVKKLDGSFAVAITMPEYRAESELPRELQKLNIPTYVHTISSIKKLEKYSANGVTEIYTDFLQP
jgi:glycerophosphoryl diester phosphodiesterase